MSGTREKFNAVFFAAIMVLSMVAFGTAFAGSAAAAASGTTVDNSPAGQAIIEVDNGTTDAEVGVVVQFNATSGTTTNYNASEDVFLNESTDASGNKTFTVDIPTDVSSGNYDVYSAAGASVTEPADGSDLTTFSDDSATGGSGVVVDNANYVVDSFTGDFNANPDSSVNIEATINNTGDLPSSGQDITTNASNAFQPQGNSQTLESGLALNPGQTQTVNADLTTADSGSAISTFGYQIDTANTSSSTGTATIAGDGFIQGSVRNTQNDPIQNAQVNVTNTNTNQEYTTTTDSGGAFTVAVPAGSTYEVDVEQSGFQSFSTQRSVTPGGTERIDVTLQRNIEPEQIRVTDVSPGPDVAIDQNVDVTVNVTSSDFAGSNAQQPLDTTPVEAGVDRSNLPAGVNDILIDGSGTNQTVDTNSQGEVTFNVSVDPAVPYESIEAIVERTVVFTAQANTSVSTTQDLRFAGAPQDGEGSITGDVKTISDDIQLGAQSENAGSGNDISVYAVRGDRIPDNQFNTSSGAGALTSVDNGSDTTHVRVGAFNTSDGDYEWLDVESDYLVTPDDVGATEIAQNTSLPGSGFDATDTSGTTDAQYSITILNGSVVDDPSVDEVRVLASDDPTFNESAGSPSVVNNQSVGLGSANDLTYGAIEERYNVSGTTAVTTDSTGADGEFYLTNLYTNGAGAFDYTVIASEDDGDFGFANTNGYATVSVDPAASPASVDLGVQATDITADTVDVVNNGTLPSATDAGDNYEASLEEFDDQSDATRQEIVRDNSTVDVIDIRTFSAESDTNAGAEVTVSIDEIENTPFEGAFLSTVDNGDLVSVDNSTNSQQITINTGEDGTSTVFLETDNVNADTNATIDAEISGVDTDSTDKEFTEVINADFETGELSGIVTDNNNNRVAATVYSSEIDISSYGSNLELLVSPVDDVDGNWTVSLNDTSGAGIIEEHNITREEAESYTFSDFDEDLSVADAGSTTLVTDTGDNGAYTMPNTIGDDPLVQHRVTGVDVDGNTGSAVAGVPVDATATANIVISGADTASFAVTELDPETATVTQGDLLDISATVSNEGTVTGSTDVDLQIDGSTIETREDVTLVGAESTTVNFTDVDTSTLDPDEYEHAVVTPDDSATGTLTVESSDDGGSTDSGSLTFEDQQVADGEVTVSDVSTGQDSTVVVTYTNGSEETVVGVASADNLNSEDVPVEIQDDSGVPGVHTAWVFNSSDVPPSVGIGSDATPIAGDALADDDANISEADGGAGSPPADDRPDSLPDAVSTDAFNAVDSDGSGDLTPGEIALAISENSNQGNVDGVEISPGEFALIISWNADQ